MRSAKFDCSTGNFTKLPGFRNDEFWVVVDQTAVSTSISTPYNSVDSVDNFKKFDGLDDFDCGHLVSPAWVVGAVVAPLPPVWRAGPGH